MTYKALSTLSPKTATVAENGDCGDHARNTDVSSLTGLGLCWIQSSVVAAHCLDM